MIKEENIFIGAIFLDTTKNRECVIRNIFGVNRLHVFYPSTGTVRIKVSIKELAYVPLTEDVISRLDGSTGWLIGFKRHSEMGLTNIRTGLIYGQVNFIQQLFLANYGKLITFKK